MRYLLLIYGNETSESRMTPAVQDAEMGARFAVTDGLRAAGNLFADEALQPTATATTVRGDAGQTLISDGPFAETKEQLGGFYLIEAAPTSTRPPPGPPRCPTSPAAARSRSARSWSSTPRRPRRGALRERPSGSILGQRPADADEGSRPCFAIR